MRQNELDYVLALQWSSHIFTVIGRKHRAGRTEEPHHARDTKRRRAACPGAERGIRRDRVLSQIFVCRRFGMSDPCREGGLRGQSVELFGRGKVLSVSV